MDNGYYRLFLQTGNPPCYMLAKQAEECEQPPNAR